MPLTPAEVRALVVAGKVITLCPAFLARRHADAPLVAIPVVDAPPMPISFATVRAEDAVVKSFLAFVREHALSVSDRTTASLDSPVSSATPIKPPDNEWTLRKREHAA